MCQVGLPPPSCVGRRGAKCEVPDQQLELVHPLHQQQQLQPVQHDLAHQLLHVEEGGEDLVALHLLDAPQHEPEHHETHRARRLLHRVYYWTSWTHLPDH